MKILIQFAFVLLFSANLSFGLIAQDEPKAELVVQTGHTSYFYSVAFSLDGKILATGSEEQIKLLDVQSGREFRTLKFDDAKLGYSGLAFSNDGKILASGEASNKIRLWNIETGKLIKTFSPDGMHEFGPVKSISFSPDSKILSAILIDGSIRLWNIESEQQLNSKHFSRDTQLSRNSGSIVFLPDGSMLVCSTNIADGTNEGAKEGTIVIIWNIKNEQKINTLKGHTDVVSSAIFSPDGKIIVSGDWSGNIKLWTVESGKLIRSFEGHNSEIRSIVMSSDGKFFASEDIVGTVKLWNVKNGHLLNSFEAINQSNSQISISPSGNILVSQGEVGNINLWNLENKQLLKSLERHTDYASGVAFSKDGRIIITDSNGIQLWSLEDSQLLQTIEPSANDLGGFETFAISSDGKILFTKNYNDDIKVWNTQNKQLLQAFNDDSHSLGEIINNSPEYDKDEFNFSSGDVISPDGKFRIESNKRLGGFNIFEIKSGKMLASLIPLDENDWTVTTPEGRFDTNKSLDNIEGLHWVISDQPLKPVSLEAFMRQFYEPGLLKRIFKCSVNDTCDLEFKPLPSISEINRVQPKVTIKEINLVKNVNGLADVKVEVESVSEDVSVSATDRDKKEKKTSKAFDLRLFRDGQLVGVSTPKDKLEPFIKDAPALIEKNKKYFAETGKLINTPEDVAWRAANDIFALVGTENVKRISPEKLEYTFRNVKLPKGQESVDFTAYAFNSDKVKSTTTEPFKFEVPKTIAAAKKKGRAFVVSIGVNASENPAYNLKYAANDARKMQEIVGARLKTNSEQYSEVVEIPLVSDHDADGNLSENAAQKAVIKGVFSLLEGRTLKDVLAEISKENPQLADVLKNIPNVEKIKAVEPEDTLIITYAGHGYADQSGIFYLLPYDIGKDTGKLTTEALRKTISSDELSLWMQDITAAEMIFIIDACHSSAAVQGDGFKPGPMGSRGLGQLAYDKDMKILSATQADNVALELGSLQQGLLSYALLEDGIVKSFADANKDKKLLSTEWLNYAEKRVPELYSEVKTGKRDVIIDGKNIKANANRAELVGLGVSNQKSSLNLQQPSLFDFKRRNTKNTLLILR